ncbi:urea ABC transporter permease subunit UrtB [Verminephrobacter aporrectodeae subsp. tuberculatae]|uniref:urea ABC transporter permease subunit UrtB n=1 Tax=Verminephrobacter aporrectodeae TaxID=1110389 RepID=UPI00223721C1|nr:urea ABC transporter permease subunit UrtB [Verminephrobacter aporrectodeae]MCW5257587.1 urea ABC transporter permease subunit UrtB [Verminephrobacter aporrectodeae subsp. tuberculatae]MCW8199817.1 urea ABC transporter permease subunit UrtB [Verminephrobacter aporrectodeae subsp. tuberculatae]MCW8207317.1 urea ABC transporter permease subunit UrtB [Verminephrobacter aporrectodeae subsp. tuberculatae]
MLRCFLALCAGLTLCTGAAQALTAGQALAMAAGDTDDRVAAVQQAVVHADERTAAFLQALADDAVKIAAGKALIVRGDQGQDPVTGAGVPLPDDAEDVISNNRMRGEIDQALATLALFDQDASRRLAAARALTRAPDAGRMALLDRALAQETQARVRAQLELARAATLLGSADAAQRIAAAQALSASATPDTRLLLNERATLEEDAKVRAALGTALRAIDGQLAWGERLGAAFSGISLGSILLLVALGLAITYGLMGVINMAHGELMMIGAYATYVVQGVFQKYFPGAFDWYLVAALPLAFGASAAVGAVLERGVLRFLYGRPLETLLATWGISLVLMQLVRTLFGAQNVGVENPAWMSGGVQLLPNLTLPYNRLVIMGFAIAVLLGMGWIIGRTRLGLFVRGVTQNRPIASCMGVHTARIDTLAFALGSGIAGLAGCALSQVGNVGPDLGQSYIVDAFMVVVLGGVGQLAGTVYAALGLGVLSKFLEGWAGAVLAKIAVLLLIIVFIQKRPQGIFALKGRSAD